MVLCITVEYRLKRGEKRYKVLGFSAIERDELPTEYLKDGTEHVFKQPNREVLVICKPNYHYNIARGDMLTEDMLSETLGVMEKSGKRLHEINEQIKYLERVWEGTMRRFTF